MTSSRDHFGERRMWVAPFASFAAFGVLWGGWGAALPALRAQAGVTDGQLGVALLFVSVGALPAMPIAGRLLDRFGFWLAAPLLVLLGLGGVLIAAVAHGFVGLAGAAVALGAVSGAADVAINTLAGRAEQQAARPLLARAHGVFSLAVVVSSLSMGALLSGGAGLVVAFATIALVMLALAALVLIGSPRASGVLPTGPVEPGGVAGSGAAARRRPSMRSWPLVVVGVVGAAAYAVENAHQSWGAVFLTDFFAASPQQAGLAAATFAGAAAITRLLLAPLSRSRPSLVLIAGGVVAAGGTLLVASAPAMWIALIGLATAAAGVALLFPTLLSRTLRDIEPQMRGRATATISTTAYAGYLIGPAFVGLLAQAIDLRVALAGIAALPLLFAGGALPVTRRTSLLLATSTPLRSVGGAGSRLADPLAHSERDRG